jgi:hypothetical protein
MLAATVTTKAVARPSARLVYSRTAGAESCPDEPALRAAVAQRIGYDPFFPWVKQTVVASMASGGKGGFVARIHLIDEKGFEFGARELDGEGSCRDLLDSAALVIAIAIDPQAITRPMASAAPPPQPAPAPEPDVTPAPEPVPASESGPESPHATPAVDSLPVSAKASQFGLDAFAGAVGSAGYSPSPTAGLALGAELGWRAVSLGLDGRIDAPTSRAANGAQVTTWLTVMSLAPCVRLNPVSACALAQAGLMRASGQVERDVLWLSAGGRLGFSMPLGTRVALRLRFEVVGDIGPPQLQVNGIAPVWSAPPAAAALGADVVTHFL